MGPSIIFRGPGLSVFKFYFYIICCKSYPSSADPDQMPHFVASDLDLHCLSMSFLLDFMHKRVNMSTENASNVMVNGHNFKGSNSTINIFALFTQGLTFKVQHLLPCEKISFWKDFFIMN